MKYKTAPGVILTSICGRYFLGTAEATAEINDTAAYYWEKLRQGASLAELSAMAVEDFEIDDTDVLKADIRELTDSLMERHYLVRCEA